MTQPRNADTGTPTVRAAAAPAAPAAPVAPADPLSGFHPTHVVPQDGLPAWEGPDLSRPTSPLDPFLPVELLARRGEWGEIRCANGWTAWVDGRLLVAVPQPPPTAGRPLTRAEDPRPLLDRTAEALDRYRQASRDRTAGRCDTETFRQATHGLRAGVVLDGERVWLYDDTAGRWMYGDGARLATYAVAAGPGSHPDEPAAPHPATSETPEPSPPTHPPTRIVGPGAP
ncbi:hypothetical protein DEJ50_30645 [Streptomyces venezuelae]|uniref:Uncharacterized protein n=1 Tax=Streptomyces venezuelae TaxID=54571 RepID=A0A5P2DEY8_STRVZ|nr:hypothetical protein [Streptomyces venezuelae]QES51559.1 hypothetical protein DEJ50_30645 [Streptomyces venezuelae]